MKRANQHTLAENGDRHLAAAPSAAEKGDRHLTRRGGFGASPRFRRPTRRRATVLLMIVGLLAMLFMLVSAFIILARFERRTLQMAGHAEQVTQTLDAITDVAAGAIRGVGGDFVTGPAYVDIPGYGGTDPNDPNGPWGSAWLASAEPVRDPYSINGYNAALPQDYRAPAVTGFGRSLDPNVPLTRLMLDADHSGTVVILTDPNDTLPNAREPFADADGDGIPDSFFGAVGSLTELANAMAGLGVRATGVNPSSLLDNASDPNYPNFLAWQQFDNTARYAVAAKIVSHGGMVQVSAPTADVLWNSAFTGAMFNWVRHPTDSGGLFPATDQTDRNQLQALWAARGSVEPALRRRGGLIAGARANTQSGEPPALWVLRDRFRWTFGGAYDVMSQKYRWQRFNLASQIEWDAWRQAATLDPEAYNEALGGFGADPRVQYAQRQLLTTVNNSDELAREQDPSLPNTLTGAPGIWLGEMKFYLGQITDVSAAPNGVLKGAFRLDGSFNDGEAITGETTARGLRIVSELAGYFNELLSPYDNWDTAGGEAVTPEEQAFMLAVNTVAFAAPRMTPTNHVDAVYYLHNDNTYIGCAPQPFITQVVAYNHPVDPNDPNAPPVDPNDPNDLARVALAIELYNPNDPAGAGNIELPRFALSLDHTFDPNVPATVVNLVDLATVLPGEQMQGRSFMLLAANAGGSNVFFDGQTYPSGVTPVVLNMLPRVSYRSAGDPLSVQLWRRGADTSPLGWYLVDDFSVDTAESTNPLGPDQEWYLNVQRDTTYEPYLGKLPSGTTPEARWRMTVAFPKDDTVYKDHMRSPPVHGAAPTAILGELGAGAGSAVDTPAFSPCVPLYLMNADRVSTMIHGAVRPASFPTPGFVLFVPRFSHVIQPTARKPVTEVLYDQWQRRTHSFATYPADFGHMPIFDDTQPVKSGSVFADSRTGRVPWGLLVFDYFTTLNPYDADGDGTANGLTDPNDALDPYRVPGRININDASWYVLAGVPLIGPNGSLTGGNLPLDISASPAFWSTASGVLAGQGSETPARPRYPELVDASGASGGQWYRLGPYLAQAAAAYRDHVPYISASPFGFAWERNAAAARYRPGFYGPDALYDPNDPNNGPGYGAGIRGGDVLSPARGFLTTGELANVMGFDGSRATDIIAGSDATVLGGYGQYVGGDFMKAVSLLALLDTHFLTTRSNTFTVYTTLFDRENPQASVRSQVTLDRSNLLPRLLPSGGNLITLQSTDPPELIARRDYSYFNAQYDQ